jgi:hypothetical protein
MVPRRLTQAATQNEKHQYLSKTTRALQDHESAAWTDKTACFSMRFNYQTTHRLTKLKLAVLKGRTHTNGFQFLYINCARENFENIAIPQAGVLTTSTCAFIACRVTMSPIQAWVGLKNPQDPIESRVWIPIPKEATVIPGQSQFSPGININMIRDPSLLTREQVANHHPCPAIGVQNRDNDLDTERFCRRWSDIYHHTLFECEAQLLQDDYVGQATMNDAANRLHEIHQTEIMPDGTRVVHGTDAHYQRIQALIDELSIKMPYGFSVMECFHNSLTQSIRNQIRADGIQIPSTALMQNVEQLDVLSACVQHAKNAENKIKSISHITKASSGQNRGPDQGNIFLANAGSHHNTGYDNYSTKDVDDFISENPYQGTPHGFMANQQANTASAAEANVLYNMMMNEAKQELQRGAHCFLSPEMNR